MPLRIVHKAAQPPAENDTQDQQAKCQSPTFDLEIVERELLATPSMPNLMARDEIIIKSAFFIRRLRQEAGYTQAQLAAKIGVSQARVAELEKPRSNAKRGPSVETLDRIARACGHKLRLDFG